MNNEVWVRWKDSTTGGEDMMTDTVVELKDGAQIKDLRKAFVEQQRITNVSPAAVQVRETEGGETIKSSMMLTDYLVPPEGSAAAPGPGRSEDSALFLTVPQQQHDGGGGDIVSEMQALRLEVHGVRETLPSVLVGHVITPSQASRTPQVVASVFDSLGLSHSPRKTDSEYVLPQLCGDDWKLSWKWPKNYVDGDDRGLERTSYHPVAEYLKKLGFICVDVSEGQCCVEKLLFNADIFTSREDNPMRVRGQRVYLRHRIQGRTDLAVLRRDNHGGYILRNMIKFVVEIKTVYGYQQSQTGCMREAQLQVIGLNAFNTHSSPPVVLSNLAQTHKVVYLDVDNEWRYEIKVQDCNSFAAAIHFADALSNRKCISQHFSRPTTPDSSD